MKRYNLAWIVFLGIMLIATLSACSKTKDNLIYVNDEQGFSMEFPERWGGEFEVVPYDHGLIISSKVNDIETLAYIHKYTMEEWQNLDYGSDIPLQFQTLGESSEAIFVLIYPGDVNYNIENEDSIKRNEEMVSDLMEGNFIFNLIERDK